MSEPCPCCGQRVSVQTADEGTSCYVGEEYNAAIEDAAVLMEKCQGKNCDAAYEIRSLKKGEK